MKKIFYILLLALLAVFIFKAPNINAQSAEAQYREASQMVEEKKYDFAFLAFRSITRDFPKSKYASDALFAVGEYLYSQTANTESISNFSEYVRKYPNSDGTVFAKTYLLKIIEAAQKPTAVEKEIINNLEKEFFSKPLFLLFSQYKEVSYKSGFANSFAIRYYVDKIEVYKNGQIFYRISQ